MVERDFRPSKLVGIRRAQFMGRDASMTTLKETAKLVEMRKQERRANLRDPSTAEADVTDPQSNAPQTPRQAPAQ